MTKASIKIKHVMIMALFPREVLSTFLPPCWVVKLATVIVTISQII